MPELGEGIAVVTGSTAKDPDVQKEERKCPVCGAVWKKQEPTLGQVRRAIQEEFMKFKERVRALDKLATLGYRGSVARGMVGDHKPHKGLEPDIRGECGTKYDVDGFLISLALFKATKKDLKGRAWGWGHQEIKSLEKSIHKALTVRKELAYMKGQFGFRVWHPKDYKKATKDAVTFAI